MRGKCEGEAVGFSRDDFGLEVRSAGLGFGTSGGFLGRWRSGAGFDEVLKPRGCGRRMVVLAVAAAM